MPANNSQQDILLEVECWLDSSPEPATINISALAHDLNLSVRTLRRRLAAQQTTFTAIFRKWRITNAKTLLRQTDMSIHSVSQRLGYTYASNFERAFKRWTGFSPGEYRKRRIGVSGPK